MTIATAVRAKYPSLQLVLGCESERLVFDLRAILALQPQVAEVYDLYDVHQWKSPSQFLEAAHEFDRCIGTFTLHVMVFRLK